jgi:hypothetical protein
MVGRENDAAGIDEYAAAHATVTARRVTGADAYHGLRRLIQVETLRGGSLYADETQSASQYGC